MEPVDCSKLQVVARKVLASSSVYYLIFMWLIRVVVFVLWIAKGILIWVLSFSFSLIRKYLSVALFSFAFTPQLEDSTFVEETPPVAAALAKEEEEVDVSSSPLLPIVERARLQVWEDNLALEDRERLSYEFDKIVAPQVSAFQLGEIIVPIDDTRQLATFLKLKLTSACKASNIDAVICGLILNIRAKGGCISHAVESTSSDLKHAVVYIAARLSQAERHIHLVLVGRKVEYFLGSSEFRSRFNPPRTRGDKNEWHKWTLAHLRSLRESAIDTAEELLAMEPVRAQMY